MSDRHPERERETDRFLADASEAIYARMPVTSVEFAATAALFEAVSRLNLRGRRTLASTLAAIETLTDSLRKLDTRIQRLEALADNSEF